MNEMIYYIAYCFKQIINIRNEVKIVLASLKREIG